MPQRVFVTGSSGFVGSAIIAELSQRGFPVTALVNRKSPPAITGDFRCVQADLFNPAALADAMTACDSVIHLVGIIMEKPAAGITFKRLHTEATRCVVEAAQRTGARRFLHMSALGVRPNAVAEYHKTKWLAEEIIRGSGLDWTIFQPSMIHGPHGEFMKMEAKWARKQSPPFFFMPYFGAGIFGSRGAGRLQPVYVQDVARAFVDAIENPKTIGKIYPLGGADQMTWPQMHKIAARAIVLKNRWIMPIPAWYAKALATILPRPLLPFNRDQVIMSQEDNICDMADFARDFAWKPAGFADALKAYAAALQIGNRK